MRTSIKKDKVVLSFRGVTWILPDCELSIEHPMVNVDPEYDDTGQVHWRRLVPSGRTIITIQTSSQITAIPASPSKRQPITFQEILND